MQHEQYDTAICTMLYLTQHDEANLHYGALHAMWSVIVSMRLPALRETPSKTNRKTNSFTEVSIHAGIKHEKKPLSA